MISNRKIYRVDLYRLDRCEWQPTEKLILSNIWIWLLKFFGNALFASVNMYMCVWASKKAKIFTDLVGSSVRYSIFCQHASSKRNPIVRYRHTGTQMLVCVSSYRILCIVMWLFFICFSCFSRFFAHKNVKHKKNELVWVAGTGQARARARVSTDENDSVLCIRKTKEMQAPAERTTIAYPCPCQPCNRACSQTCA